MTDSLDFLTPSELVALTDRKHSDAQIAWLESRGIAYFVSGKGRPKVLRSAVLAQIGQTDTMDPVVLP